MPAKKPAKVAKKTDLLEAMMKETGWEKKDCKEAVDAFFAASQKLLKKNDRLTLTGVGSFQKKVTPAQKGGKKAKNPFTGETYITKDKPKSTKVAFRPSKGWMENF